MDNDKDRYTIFIKYMYEEQAYLAEVSEFSFDENRQKPVTASGKTRAEALAAVELALQERIDQLTASGEELPQPEILIKPSTALKKADIKSLAYVPAFYRMRKIYVAGFIVRGEDEYGDPIFLVVDPGPDASELDKTMLQSSLWDIFGMRVEVELLTNVKSKEILDGMVTLQQFIGFQT